MKTSTEIASIAKHVGEEKAILYVAQAGFDAWDFSMFEMARFDWKSRGVLDTDHPLRKENYLSFARELRKIGEDNGIVCNQSHAPFPVSCPEIRDFLKTRHRCTAEAGGGICVIHPEQQQIPGGKRRNVSGAAALCKRPRRKNRHREYVELGQ